MKKIFTVFLIIFLPMYIYFLLSRDEFSINLPITPEIPMPKIIKFSEPMCMTCLDMDGVIKKVYPAYADKVDLILYDVNDKKEMKNFDIQVLPTIVFMKKDGTIIHKLEGQFSEFELTRYLDDLIK